MIDEYGLHWTDVNWIAGPNQRFAPCDEAAEKTFEGDLERLRSYRAAMNAIGYAADQECGRWLNHRVKNSHQPFRRREGAMSKFRDIKTLQKFGSIHASIHNHFNLERHLNRRETFKENRAAALAEWRQLAA
jgi:putative transposase